MGCGAAGWACGAASKQGERRKLHQPHLHATSARSRNIHSCNTSSQPLPGRGTPLSIPTAAQLRQLPSQWLCVAAFSICLWELWMNVSGQLQLLHFLLGSPAQLKDYYKPHPSQNKASWHLQTRNMRWCCCRWCWSCPKIPQNARHQRCQADCISGETIQLQLTKGGMRRASTAHHPPTTPLSPACSKNSQPALKLIPHKTVRARSRRPLSAGRLCWPRLRWSMHITITPPAPPPQGTWRQTCPPSCDGRGGGWLQLVGVGRGCWQVQLCLPLISHTRPKHSPHTTPPLLTKPNPKPIQTNQTKPRSSYMTHSASVLSCCSDASERSPVQKSGCTFMKASARAHSCAVCGLRIWRVVSEGRRVVAEEGRAAPFLLPSPCFLLPPHLKSNTPPLQTQTQPCSLTRAHLARKDAVRAPRAVERLARRHVIHLAAHGDIQGLGGVGAVVLRQLRCCQTERHPCRWRWYGLRVERGVGAAATATNRSVAICVRGARDGGAQAAAARRVESRGVEWLCYRDPLCC